MTEARPETSLPVQRLFGRTPGAEDWRCAGRWAYASAWLATDRGTARQMVRARLSGAATLATNAAMAAGRRDGERFALVSAIARLPMAFEAGEGALGEAAETAVEDGADQLMRDGDVLRSETSRERSVYASRFSLNAFTMALEDVGQDRNILFREAARDLDDIFPMVKGACPALKTLRCFLRASLTLDSSDVSALLENVSSQADHGIVAALRLWLTADLALAARRGGAYETAWSTAARVHGDALSCILAWLTSGAVHVRAVEALADDPWALLLALAMTTESEHASKLLDLGVEAQSLVRSRAAKALARWTAEDARIEALETRLELLVDASEEVRKGYREHEGNGAADLFTLWAVIQEANAAASSLREAAERAVAREAVKCRETVRRTKSALQAAHDAHDAAIEDARKTAERSIGECETTGPSEATEAGAQRGCLFGMGTGVSVILTYVAVGFFVGKDGMMQRIAPLVAGGAAIPVAAGILANVVVSARRAAAASAASRRNERIAQEFARLREAIDRAHAPTLEGEREALAEAEARLSEFERLAAPEARAS